MNARGDEQFINIRDMQKGEIVSLRWERDHALGVKTLAELNEDVAEAEGLAQFVGTEEEDFLVDLEITKHENAHWEEFLILSGHVYVRFPTLCVSTGRWMMDTLDLDLHCVLLAASFDSPDAYAEHVDVDYEGQDHDIYFLDKGKIDLYSIVHEQLYLGKNPYPKIETADNEDESL
jgi:hypothetical protein